MTKGENPVLDHLKQTEGGEGDSDIVTLSTGIRARILPVGATILQELSSQIQEPKVPTFFNEDKGREEENPNDPEYTAAVREYRLKQTMAVSEAMIMLGLELVDGVPEDDDWLRKIRYLEKRGHLDLSAYDLDDDLDRELLYKKFVAVGTEDLIRIGRKAGLSDRDVEEAAKSFQG